MPRYHRSFVLSVALLGVAVLASVAIVATATSKDDIAHPIAELGNCGDESACRAYCDDRSDLERVKACIAFARRHHLLTVLEIEEAERYMLRLGITEGPGGCRSEVACRTYCDDIAHLDLCLAFAERHGLRSTEEIAEGRKVAEVLRAGGALPGGCRNKDECMAYCDDSSHMRECIAFGEKAGFIGAEEAALAQKIIPILEQGGKTPGNCGRKIACERYCMEPSHLDECLVFAERVGALSPEELADAKRFAPYIKRGETPGACTRKQDCEAYCSDSAHFEECVVFAEKAGIMSRADAELARKAKGMGPGGCRSRAECDTYCRMPEHQETCLSFVKEHGLEKEFSDLEAEVRRTSEGREAAVRGEVEGQMRACAEKPCAEFIPCLQGLNDRPDNDRGAQVLPAGIQGKLNMCIAEMQQNAANQWRDGGSGTMENTPPGDTAQQPQAGYEQQYEEQYDAAIREYCHLFEAAPTCEYAAEPGTQNYDICKRCFPHK